MMRPDLSFRRSCCLSFTQSDVCDGHRDRITLLLIVSPFGAVSCSFRLGKAFAASPDPDTPVFSGADPGARRDLSLRTRNLFAGTFAITLYTFAIMTKLHLRGCGAYGHSPIRPLSLWAAPFFRHLSMRSCRRFARVSDKRPVPL